MLKFCNKKTPISTMIDEQVSNDQASNSDVHPSSSKNTTGSIKTAGTLNAGDPNFLKDYYARSRLHFISTWAQEMKSYVSELKSNSQSSTFDGLKKLNDYLTEKRI